MADEDISLNEDQLLGSLDDPNNGDSEYLNEVNIAISPSFRAVKRSIRLPSAHKLAENQLFSSELVVVYGVGAYCKEFKMADTNTNAARHFVHTFQQRSERTLSEMCTAIIQNKVQKWIQKLLWDVY